MNHEPAYDALATGAVERRASDRKARVAIAALLTGAMAIACAPIFVRLSELGPTATAFYRVLLAVPVLSALWGIEGRRGDAVGRPATVRDFMSVALAGLFFAGDLGVWHWSIRLTSVANATLFPNFAPIFVTLGAFVIFRERFSRVFLSGVACAVVGACILVGDSVTLGFDNVLGDVLGIITAAFYGAYILTVGRLRARFTTLSVMCWSSAAAAAVLLPFALASGESLVPMSLYGWFILVGLAVVSHAMGQGLIAYALAHLPATFSSVTLLVQPVASTILAWIILAEPVGGWQALGAAVILVGIALARRGSR